MQFLGDRLDEGLRIIALRPLDAAYFEARVAARIIQGKDQIEGIALVDIVPQAQDQFPFTVEPVGSLQNHLEVHILFPEEPGENHRAPLRHVLQGGFRQQTGEQAVIVQNDFRPHPEAIATTDVVPARFEEQPGGAGNPHFHFGSFLQGPNPGQRRQWIPHAAQDIARNPGNPFRRIQMPDAGYRIQIPPR